MIAKSKHTVSKILLALTFLGAPNIHAHASDAKAFLEELAGEYRGRGQVLVGVANNAERVSCRVNNQFSEDSLALAINGKCATTQGKMDVDGTLEVKGDNNIVGSFISTSNNSKITKSSSTFKNGTLTLSMYMINNTTGGLSRTRQVVSKNGKGGFSSVFYSYDNASSSFQETGKVNFVPK